MLTWRPDGGWFSLGVRSAVVAAGVVVLASGLPSGTRPPPPAPQDETTNVQEGLARRRELCRLAARAQAAVDRPWTADPSRSAAGVALGRASRDPRHRRDRDVTVPDRNRPGRPDTHSDPEGGAGDPSGDAGPTGGDLGSRDERTEQDSDRGGGDRRGGGQGLPGESEEPDDDPTSQGGSDDDSDGGHDADVADDEEAADSDDDVSPGDEFHENEAAEEREEEQRDDMRLDDSDPWG